MRSCGAARLALIALFPSARYHDGLESARDAGRQVRAVGDLVPAAEAGRGDLARRGLLTVGNRTGGELEGDVLLRRGVGITPLDLLDCELVEGPADVEIFLGVRE